MGEVFATVAHNRPTPDQASALRERTDGNPFYVVEYARLAGERADLAHLIAEEHPPAGVQEVLTRRLARLPESTVGALRTAAVIGRRFDAPTLALATGIDPDDLLDVVEPAEAAGLVRDVGVERFAFAHALVRDTLTAGLSATRRARVHVRVAEALEDLPERATERALHCRPPGRRTPAGPGARPSTPPHWRGVAMPTSSRPCCSAVPSTRWPTMRTRGLGSATTC